MHNQAYKIDIKIKNNLIYQRILKEGFKNVNQFCKAHGLNATVIGMVINMQSPVVNRAGEWTFNIKKLSNIFNCEPEDIISEEQKSIVNNKKIEIYANYQQLVALTSNNRKYASLEYIDEEIDQVSLKDAINKQLATLSTIEKKVLQLRFGLLNSQEMTLKETAEQFDLSCERIRQIEAKALRKLRDPYRSVPLKEARGIV